MRKSSLGFALTAAAGAMVLAATPALAATWTVSAGGTFTFTDNIVFTDTNTAKQVTCTATVSGTLTNGTNPNPIGYITSATFSGCSGGGFTFTVVPSFPPGGWTINGDSYAPPVTAGHIGGIKVELKTTPSSTCDVVLDGLGGGNSGVVSFTYDNTSGVLTLNPKVGVGDNLVATVVAGCIGVFSTRDSFTVAGQYSVTNSSGGIPQISSP